MHIILLSGGSGKRLWPLSNDIRSKQFIKIFKTEDDCYESMVQRMYRQIKSVDTDATITVATSKSQISQLINQIGEEAGISVEPCRRDTFPAIALATAYLHDVQGVSENEPVVVCPVDPYVERDYFEALRDLSCLAQEGEANLTVMGIEPRGNGCAVYRTGGALERGRFCLQDRLRSAESPRADGLHRLRRSFLQI